MCLCFVDVFLLLLLFCLGAACVFCLWSLLLDVACVPLTGVCVCRLVYCLCVACF